MLPYLRARFVEIDRLLRGDLTQPESIEGQTLDVSARGLTVTAVLLAMVYGLCMGSFSLLKQVPAGLDDPYGPALQLLATMIKTPALFLLTLVVTLPSLYVSNALIGSRLTLLGMARLLVASIAVNIAVLASLGTIVLFFSLTTTSYPFIVLLNVAAFTVAGALGLMFLLQTLHRVTSSDESQRTSEPQDQAANVAGDVAPTASEEGPIELTPVESTPEPISPVEDRHPSPLEMPRGQFLGVHTRLVFRCWIVLFALVGAQMGWVLRPFIGQPDLPFTFFRERDSNFFAAVLGEIQKLLFGG